MQNLYAVESAMRTAFPDKTPDERVALMFAYLRKVCGGQDTEYTFRADDKPFTWIVEMTVGETWVADGFDLDSERAHAMLANDLQYAYGYELGARVLSAPDPELIRKAQGYND